MTQHSAATADEVKSSAVPYLQTQDAQTGDSMREVLTQLTPVFYLYLCFPSYTWLKEFLYVIVDFMELSFVSQLSSFISLVHYLPSVSSLFFS